MKKIMFNDRYGLTRAVLDGRKTMTRRIVNMTLHEYELLRGLHQTAPMAYKTRYSIGERVAIAQEYSDCGGIMSNGVLRWKYISKVVGRSSAGWRNKMFVRADLMPHQIRITDIRVERLQGISDDDCLREGIRYIADINKYYFERTDRDEGFYFENPRESFAALIGKVSGSGTWDKNPYVFVYQFELVK